MSAEHVITEQKVNPARLEFAKHLRSQMTEDERIPWERLRGRRLCGLHFRRQQIVDGYVADFYCHAGGLVVEVDGGIHESKTQSDAERDRILGARGLRILRIANEDVTRNLPAVLRCIAEAAQQQRAPSPFPLGKGARGLGPEGRGFGLETKD